MKKAIFCCPSEYKRSYPFRDVAQWLHDASIPFLIRNSNVRDANNELSERFYSFRAYLDLIIMPKQAQRSVKFNSRYSYMIRDSDAVLFKVRFPHFYEIDREAIKTQIVGEWLTERIAAEIIGEPLDPPETLVQQLIKYCDQLSQQGKTEE